jgi:hypothetical protein
MRYFGYAGAARLPHRPSCSRATKPAHAANALPMKTFGLPSPFGRLKSFPSETEMTFKLSNYETKPPVTLRLRRPNDHE